MLINGLIVLTITNRLAICQIASFQKLHKFTIFYGKKYKNKKNGKVAIIISDKSAGMCSATLGKTFVVYKYEGDTYNYPFIMEQKEFYQTHCENS
jgi:hypothetical protein